MKIRCMIIRVEILINIPQKFKLYICLDKESNDSNFKIIVSCNNEIKFFYIHTAVLNSKYFIKLMHSDFTPQYHITLQVDNIESIKLLLKYLYLGKIDKDDMAPGIANELLKISDEFQFDELHYICKYYI